jgi:hypothetical protein
MEDGQIGYESSKRKNFVMKLKKSSLKQLVMVLFIGRTIIIVILLLILLL